jgi:hypothetical protein
MFLLKLLLLLLTVGKDPTIRFFVSELGADEHPRRERATVVLGHLGPLAYPELRKATASKDAEVRRRAEDLIRPLQLKALSRAARRQVVIVAPKRCTPPNRNFGTVIAADGKEALILTSQGTAVCCKDGAVVEWGGEKYPARFVKIDEDLGLALASIRCRKKVSPLPLASGRTVGCWFNHRADLKATFKENMALVEPAGKDGGGVFTLDETNLRLMLTGVHAGGLLDESFVRTPWTPGPEQIRRFLKRAEGKAGKK